jgi:hypothetical protein
VRVDTPLLASSRRLVCAAALTAACGAASGPTPDTKAEAPAKAAPARAEAPAKATALAKLRDDVPLPLPRLLGRPVAEVQAELGEHLQKGFLRKSCLRFAPERTWFQCEYAMQRYADRTGNFAAVRVTYEDGVSAAVAYDGWKHGSGAFDPQALLAAVGLELPEPGVESAPTAGVRVWRWFNNVARLVIDGKQHRVEVSVRGDDWGSSRVEVFLNDPLTPAQQARVMPVGGAGVSEPPDDR